MYNVDVAATQAINGFAGKSAVLDFWMIWISAIGVPILVLAVAIQWWRKGRRLHVRHVLIATGLSFLVGLALNQLILLFVHRPRPYEAGVTHLLIAKGADPSFPSDHATASAAIAFAFLVHGMRKQASAFFVAQRERRLFRRGHSAEARGRHTGPRRLLSHGSRSDRRAQDAWGGGRNRLRLRERSVQGCRTFGDLCPRSCQRLGEPHRLESTRP